MPARGWGRDGRGREDYSDGDDVECDVPPRACSTPGCRGTTRDIGTLPRCKNCKPSTKQWRLK